jgi:NADPH:quinone reductase-like Zn-dependent oxidoreductase
LKKSKPTPKDDEVLVRFISSVNLAEWYGMTGCSCTDRQRFLQTQRHPIGGRFCGGRSCGKNVTQFKPRDEVFGGRSGAFAEYVCVRQNIVHKPTNVTFEQAGGVAIAALTALQGLRDHGKLNAGQKVLINGASGGVGTFAVQIAKALEPKSRGMQRTMWI